MHYRFEHFVLDTRLQSLSYQGRMLNCDERIINLLLLLIEHAPEYIDKQTLLDILWPDTIVSDWSISRLISDTRKLLKSAGADFPVIQTLHGRGYRLSAEVLSILQSENISRPAPTPTSPARQLPRLWPATLILPPLLALVSWLVIDTDSPASINQFAESKEITARILWVDDHPENNLAEREYLQHQGMAVYTAANTSDALMLLAMYHYDVVISDMGRQDDPLAGMKLVEQMRQSGNNTPYLLYTTIPAEAQQLLHQHGAQGVAVNEDKLYQLLAHYMPLQPLL
ncbi:MAG: winged helix-turn-helix domain-containing protein [Shewanella sp.]|nr:winged helix-turn-helix domain-containing protein [Shewanella sp.]MCF1458951.1 winged helix-turn-helix domain-containing protein [Shewanella sp.]